MHKADFDTYLNSKFQIHYLPDKALDVTLVTVSESKSDQRLEQFSLVFRGSQQENLQQGVYWFKHPQLGGLELFITFIGQNQAGRHYEAVFTRFTV